MTSDFKMVTTVKREFARRLPSTLVSLVLEFANWINEEQKRVCVRQFRVIGQSVNDYFVREISLWNPMQMS